MARILFAWELGAGLGHLVPMRVFAEALLGRGHEVVAVVRNLCSAARVFENLPIDVWQAPFRQGRAEGEMRPIANFARLLNNVSLSEPGELACLLKAWGNVFAAARPDAIVADHSPVALLAARGVKAVRGQMGTGFFCPSMDRPLPVFEGDAAGAAADEAVVLDRANAPGINGG